MPDETWPKVAVLGAGAVGCYFGSMLARAGAPVTLIGRPHHVEALERDGLWLEGLHFQGRVRVGASTSAGAAQGAAVVLLAVKSFDTDRSFGLVEISGDQLYFQVVSRTGDTVDSGVIQ